jgi:lipoprotein-releasing system ATP-binding protein
MSKGPVLEAKAINKFFHNPVEFQVLRDVTFAIERGEFVSVVGKSGCGKSTLLYILSTMDTDYKGELFLNGERMKDYSPTQLAHVRNAYIGFVFQFHYLLPEFTVLKNVMLPALKLGKFSAAEIEHMAIEKLRILGIESEARKLSNQLSGGQKQRVAIARALINDPLILMCDEPTGNLDSKNSENVFNIFRELKDKTGQSLLVVTHDNDFANRTDRIIEMEDGYILNEHYPNGKTNGS